MIDATFVCLVPQVVIDGIPATVSLTGKVCGIPPAGTLVETDDGREGFGDEDTPGIIVRRSRVDPHTGALTVYCEHIAGCALSALDLITLDGWQCDSKEDEAAYRELCEVELYGKASMPQ